MNLKKLANTLSALEREILPLLNKYHSLEDLMKQSGLKEIEAMRALQWLSNKKIIDLKEELKEVVKLDENGRQYLEKDLPEKRFLEAISYAALTLEEIRSKADLNKEELNACLGILRKKNAINIGKDSGFLIISINENGRALLEKETLEEKFLKLKFPLEIKNLTNEEKYAFEELKKRKDIIKIDLLKIRSAYLTLLGKKINKIKLKKKIVDSLNSSMIKTGSWKNKEFRAYDIGINVPKIYGGKRHFVKEALNHAKQIWLDLGFKEVKGNLLQTSFWNFDALFTAQDHPVRELQDTFYIKDPEFGKLPKLVNKVKQAHEKGVAGSTGWQYSWNENEAKKNVLRTHTTVLSGIALSNLNKKDLPAKLFFCGSTFRNETIDYSHLFEFTQIDGIVVDPNANFRHLIGYLKEFFNKMGYEKIRIRPGYFPYTEPSAEVDVFDNVRGKWIELAGAGILRPEVVVPLLGEDIPVLAWGIGFSRTVMMYYGINDLRDFYKNDLKQIRNMKEWL